MKLKNKKTGELGEPRIGYQEIYIDTENNMTYWYKTLYGVFEEWEIYEEPKEKHHWFISGRGTIEYEKDADDEFNRGHKSLGNYFETKEEAEKAVERLRAWKRLKDEGMRIYSFKREKSGIDLDYYTLTILAPRDKDSLDLLFGGEE